MCCIHQILHYLHLLFQEPLCSQSTASVLEDGPWSALQHDLAGEGQSLMKRYTITWVKQKAAARQLVGQKIPFLAAVLHSIDCSSPDPCVVLRDQTGKSFSLAIFSLSKMLVKIIFQLKC